MAFSLSFSAASFKAHLLHLERFCKEYLINTPHSAFFSLFQIYGCKLLNWKHIKDDAADVFKMIKALNEPFLATNRHQVNENVIIIIKPTR